MFLFGNCPGVVGTAITDGALPFAVVVGGVNAVPKLPSPAILKAILIGFRGSERSAVGLATTLRDRLYVWLFGEKSGTVTISGVAFGNMCGAGFGATTTLHWTGLDAVYSYYEQARANTLGLPVRLVLGPNTTRYGFLDEFVYDMEDSSTGLTSFQFKFKSIPRSQIGGNIPPPLWAGVNGA